MKILILVAGMNEPSNANFLADHFAEGLKSAGAEVQKVHLKDQKIDHFDLTKHYDHSYQHEADFNRLHELFDWCDSFVIATPIWNFGVPAHLKNFIARMGSFALDESRSRGVLGGKLFYCIFTGGAPVPAWKGLMQKTTSFVPEGFKYFGATYMGHHFEGKSTLGRGKFGLVVDQRPESLAAVKRKGATFASQVETYISTGQPPLLHRTKAKAMKWGEKIMKKIF